MLSDTRGKIAQINKLYLYDKYDFINLINGRYKK